MEVSLNLNGSKTITLKPVSEDWKVWSELIKDGEKYEVYRENNSPNLILKQIKDLVK